MTVPTPNPSGLRSSEWLVVVGGLCLGVASVVPWYKPEEFAFEGSRTNGWEDPDAILSQSGTVLGVALALLVLVVGRTPQRPTFGTLGWGTGLTVAGCGVVGLIALKYSLNMEDTTVGVYLALASAVTLLYGAYVTRLESAPSTPVPPPVPGPQVGLPPARSDPRPPPPTGAVAVPPTRAAEAEPAVAPPATTPQPSAPATLPGPAVPPGQPTAPTAAPQVWPETTYFLAAWLAPAGAVEEAVTGYLATFGTDPARIRRLLGELHALLDPARGDGERDALVASQARRWAANRSRDVLGHVAQQLARPSGT